jgi:hypothetical protein
MSQPRPESTTVRVTGLRHPGPQPQRTRGPAGAPLPRPPERDHLTRDRDHRRAPVRGRQNRDLIIISGPFLRVRMAKGQLLFDTSHAHACTVALVLAALKPNGDIRRDHGFF